MNPGDVLRLRLPEMDEDRKGILGGTSKGLTGGPVDRTSCLGQVFPAVALRDSWTFPFTFVVTCSALDYEAGSSLSFRSPTPHVPNSCRRT